MKLQLTLITLLGTINPALGQTIQRLEPTQNIQQQATQPIGGDTNQQQIPLNRPAGLKPLVGIGQSTQGIGTQTRGYGGQINGYGAAVNGIAGQQDRCTTYPPPPDCR